MYDQDLKRKWDNDAARVNSVEEGRAKGLAEKNLELAVGMKHENVPYETICKLTKLSIEEIEQL